MKKPVILIVLDGWGHREDALHNAIAASKKPNFDRLWKTYPHSLLEASGPAVGLPEGQIGNSEVGHTTIGIGRPADTDLVRIDKSISLGEFDKNPALLSLFEHVKNHDSTLHIQGLVSNGGVHSHQNHLFAFLRAAQKNGVKKIAIHVFTDGRDTPPQSASDYVRELETVLDELNAKKPKNEPGYFIATISGRYYAMDRDNNWDRLARVEQAMFECKGHSCTIKPSLYLKEQYAAGKRDELLEPIVCTHENGIGAAIGENDAVFFFNFRADRARMLSKKMLEIAGKKNIHFVTLTEYSDEFDCPVAFPVERISETLGKAVSDADLTQARIAETEKFPHATYFLNGGTEITYPGEEDILLASRKDVKTHDEAPEMRAEAIADAAIQQIEKGTDFIFINFANPDMVGHTANVPAIITAIEVTDTQLGRVITALEKKGGVALVIADHGNAEVNIDLETGEKHTAHTTNPVPCIVTHTDYALKNGGLSDVAPTILALLGVQKPKGMTGNSLLKK